MKNNWKAGDTIPPSEGASMWTATIDVQGHFSAIAIYAKTEEEAVRRRNFILTACADFTAKGEMLAEQQLLNLAAEHGFGRMVAREKKNRIGPPPPDIFVGAWEDFLALARAIPSIYRESLRKLRNNLIDALGEGAVNDAELVEKVSRLRAGVTPATEPTAKQIEAFREKFKECNDFDMSHSAAVRLALAAAMQAAT